MDSKINYINTAKAFAIAAVVLGHIASPFVNFIFAWHMPFFFFVAGIFIDPKLSFKEFAIKNTKRLGYPYLVFGMLGIVAELTKRVLLHRPLGDLESYLTGLLFWMDYSHLIGYHHILWFLPALILWRIFIFVILKYIQLNGYAIIAVCLLAALGYYLPIQLPFALNQALIASPWIWIGYLCFNQKHFNLPRYKYQYWGASGLGFFIFAFIYIPTLNLATNELPFVIQNYLFASIFSIFLIATFSLLPIVNNSQLLSEWGQNTMLIMIAHPYTNNVAYLISERWLFGLWYFKLLISLLFLHFFIKLKLRYSSNFLARLT
jgi:acyltransferase